MGGRRRTPGPGPYAGPADVGDSRELLPELARIPGHLLWRANARVISTLGGVMPAGIDIHAYGVLLALAGGVTRSQQELARTISVSATTMGRVAADLVAQGLVERTRNPVDRRSYQLTRTPEGAAAARRWRRHAEDVEDAVTIPFDLAEQEEFRTLLHRLVAPELAPDVPEVMRDSIPFLITRLQVRMHREFSELLRPLGIEPRDVGALVALRSTGPIPQAELARHLGVSDPAVVQIVDELEERGLVERRRTETDRRQQSLHLLPAAEDVMIRATTAVDALSALLEPLSQAETDRLVTLLQRFVTAT